MMKRKNQEAHSQSRPGLADVWLEQLFAAPVSLGTPDSQECDSAPAKDEGVGMLNYLREMANVRWSNTLQPRRSEEEREGEVFIVPAGVRQGTVPVLLVPLPSTSTRAEFSSMRSAQHRWVECAISYDNQIFLGPTLRASEPGRTVDHRTMGIGTMLKAMGEICIETKELESDDANGVYKTSVYIRSHSHFFMLKPNNLAVILAVMKMLGFEVTNGNYFIQECAAGGQLKPVDQAYIQALFDRFQDAQGVAEDVNLPMDSNLAALFLAIDDAVLSSQQSVPVKQHCMSQMDGLKKDIIRCLKSMISTRVSTGLADASVKEAASDAAARVNYYSKVTGRVEELRDRYAIDLCFVKDELFSWGACAYLSALSVQEQAARRIEELQVVQRRLEAYLTGSAEMIAGRMPASALSKHRESFLKFYQSDPVRTCVILLRDYAKERSRFKRFVAGVWGRHHIAVIENFLDRYARGQVPADLVVKDIYREIFGIEEGCQHLEDHRGPFDTLYDRLEFCAILNKEVPGDGWVIVDPQEYAPISNDSDRVSSNVTSSAHASTSDSLRSYSNAPALHTLTTGSGLPGINSQQEKLAERLTSQIKFFPSMNVAPLREDHHQCQETGEQPPSVGGPPSLALGPLAS